MKPLGHYSINKSTDVLGKTYDYQIIYEHSALAAYNVDPTKLIGMCSFPTTSACRTQRKSFIRKRLYVSLASFSVAAPTVRIPGTRVIWD
jgi:hypothetical protein